MLNIEHRTGKIHSIILPVIIPISIGTAVLGIIFGNALHAILICLAVFSVLYVLLLYYLGDRYLKFTLIMPAVLILAAVSIFPFVYAMRASLSDVSAINLMGKWNFIGFENYKSLFKDRLFWNALFLTLEYLVIAVTLEYLLGLGFALLLNRLPNFLLSIFLIPMMVTPIAAGLIWKSMFNIDNGFINIFLESNGIEGVPWLTYQTISIFQLLPQSFQLLAEKLNITYGFLAIVVVDIWQWTPLMCLFILTGLRSLPVESFELPKVDGANGWQTLRYITLPLLRPVIIVAVLLRMIEVFKVYDTIYALFGTGVGVRTLNVHLTTYIFRTHDYGEGSALSILILILVSIIVPLFFTITSRESK